MGIHLRRPNPQLRRTNRLLRPLAHHRHRHRLLRHQVRTERLESLALSSEESRLDHGRGDLLVRRHVLDGRCDDGEG